MQNSLNEKKIAVLMGGWSSEREISLRSGENVYNILKQMGLNVVSIDITKDSIKELPNLQIDLAVIMLHGKFGEDGCIQGMLECLGIPYTGSGVAASAIAMNKILTKSILKQAGLPVAPHIEISQENIEQISSIGFPLVLKAACEGSSVGVEIMHNRAELDKRLESFINEFDRVFAEKFIFGRELTVGVLKNKDCFKTYPILELKPKNEFYDFNAKYTAGMTDFIIPAPMPESQKLFIWDLAVKAYKELGLSGVARIDFILDQNNRPWILEANSIPGMTATSDIPAMAKAEGQSMEELMYDILESAM